MLPKSSEKPANRLREVTALLDSPEISALFDKVRTAVEPPPLETAPTEPSLASKKGGVRLATPAMAVLVLCVWCCYGGARSPWMRLTLPGGAHSANVVAGDTSLYNGDFFANESLTALRQLDLFKGSEKNLRGPIALADPHVGYAVLSNLFTVGLNSPYALRVFNLVLFALCAWLVKRLTDRLFEDRAKSQLATALFVLSIAATAHAGDLSPNFLTIAFYYLWTLLLLQIEVRQRPLTGPLLLGLSALLGAWSLVSTTSLFGLATLALFLFKRRQLLAIALPAIAWFAVPQLQHAAFTHFGIAAAGSTDFDVAWQGLSKHLLSLTAHPFGYSCFLAVELGNELLNDNPLNVLVGFAGLLLLRHREKWLLWVGFVVPITVGMVLLPTTPARGAAVAGNTIILFALVSHCAVEASRWIDRRISTRLAVLPIVVLLVMQAVWSQSSLIGWRYPAAAYATGAFENAGLFWPSNFLSMIGTPQEQPTITGGVVTAGTFYGVGEGFGRQSILPLKRLAPYADRWSGRQSLLKTLILQGPLILCVAAAALMLMRLRWSLPTALLLATWFGAAQLCGAATGLDHHVLRQFDDRIAVKEDEKILAHVDLSAEFRELLERAAHENLQVEFALRLHGVNGTIGHPAEIQVDEWTSDEPRFAVDATAFLEALKAHKGRMELAISPKAGSRGLLVHSWQNLGNPDGVMSTGPSSGRREARIVRSDGSIEPLEWFPSFEIRVVRGANDYPFRSVIGPYLASRPAGYVLVGF